MGGVASNENEYPYAPDQFDHEADRTGAHGAHREDEPFWKRNLAYLLIALAAILALIAAIWILTSLGGNDSPEPAATQSSEANKDAEKPSATPTEEESSTPPADKSRPVLVLNGTKKSGLAGDWKGKLEDEGWEKVDTDTGKSADQPGVFYKDDEDLGTATELAKLLGVEPEKSTEHSASITVIVTERPDEGGGDGANGDESAEGNSGNGDEGEGGDSTDGNGGDNGGDDGGNNADGEN